jgi:small subunit ribosomal protein S4
VVFRLGLAPTRRAARQLVTHNHITVNGDNINIPSYALKVDDLVSIRERSKSLEIIAISLSSNRSEMEWLEFNTETKIGKVVAAPERIQIPENIKEQVIVELYSK